MSWQPIDSAPRGARVILYWPATRPARGHAGHTLREMIGVDRVGNTPHRPPTHWMPLPAPPEDE